MTVARKKHTRLIQSAAIGLIITYGSISVAVDLLHNHNDLTTRSDCPACLWHQISQDSDPDTSLADNVSIGFDVISYLSPFTDAGILESRDTSPRPAIRAPPAL